MRFFHHAVLAIGWHETVKALYERYTAWCDGEKEQPASKIAFGSDLATRGFVRKALAGNVTAYWGVRLES